MRNNPVGLYTFGYDGLRICNGLIALIVGKMGRCWRRWFGIQGNAVECSTATKIFHSDSDWSISMREYLCGRIILASMGNHILPSLFIEIHFTRG
jgi:hypothetical protein